MIFCFINLNKMRKWSNNEIKKLLVEIKNKIPIYKIANNHKRTITAIKFKLIHYAIELIKEKKLQPNLNDISKITNLSKKDLIAGFKIFKFKIQDDNDEKILNFNHHLINI